MIYPWLQPYWEQLSRYLEQDRLPSALMLVGDEGVGLSSFAKSFANRVICLSPNVDNTACGLCDSCLLFDAGNYPDFFHLVPEEGKTSIRIDAIRHLSTTLALTNQYAKPRIVIIDPADAMLHQASNSLLKTLEEPSENTCLILIGHKLPNISATIKSRCQLVSVKDVDLKSASLWLSEQGCESAEQYLSLANYSPIGAKGLWEQQALETRQALFKGFLAILKGRLDPILFAEKCNSLKGLPVLKWMMSWLTDSVKYAHDPDNKTLLNPDMRADLQVLKEKLHLKDIHGLLDRLGRLVELESSQVNQQLMLEEFAIQCYSLTVK